jgi:hypothetical protein
MYNVTLREGDIVIIHTGWGDLFEQFPAQNAAYNSGAPGIGKRRRTGSSRRRSWRSAWTPGSWTWRRPRIPRKPSPSTTSS